jgi:catechol 2,3-dioxygenase-like lactoylglutathione lyase family enzyme
MMPHGLLETVLYVANLDAAERFYTEVLGLTLVSRDADRHVFFRSARDMFLVFNPEATTTQEVFVNAARIPPHGTHGPGHAAFRVHEAELPAWRERLRTAGVEIVSEVTWPQGGH